MRADASTSTDACALVATIGTTSSTAAIDPVPPLADRCADAGVWLHVDAAYAGLRGRLPRAPAALRRLGARRLDRRQPAQVAPHPDGLLAFFTRPPRRPARAFSLVPEYLRVDEDVVSLSEYASRSGGGSAR